jgi:hypothetical protein
MDASATPAAAAAASASAAHEIFALDGMGW